MTDDVIDEEALFNEIAKGEQGSGDGDLADRLQRDREDEPKQVEDKPDVGDPPPEKGKQEQTETKPEPESEFQALQKQLRALTDQVSSGMRDLHGKYGGLSQQFGSIKGELAAAKQVASATAKAGGDAPTQRELTEAAADKAAGKPQRWNQIMEEFPDLAGGVEDLVSGEIKALRAELAAIKSQQPTGDAKDPRVDDLLKEKAERDERDKVAAAQAEHSALREKHPDYLQIGQTDDWATFTATLPPGLRNMANSTSAADVSYVLDIYKKERGLDKTRADVDAERQNRLKGAANLPRSGGSTRRPAVSFDDMTEEEQFEVLARQSAKGR